MEHLRGPLHKFALSLFDAIKKQNPEGNLLFSPMTASAALILLMSGAEGSTKSEMQHALHLQEENKFAPPASEQDIQMAYRRVLATISRASNDDDDKRRQYESPATYEDYGAFQVFRINKLFLQEGMSIVEEFRETVQKLKGEIGFVDFVQSPGMAREEINTFIERVMNGKVKECFPVGSISKSTQIVLANGICFRARWEYPFDIDKTILKPFYSAPVNGKTEFILSELSNKPVYTVKEVATMQGAFALPYCEDPELDIHYVELPYVFNAASFLVLLPRKKNGLKDLQKSLTPQGFSRLNQCKRMKDIELSLPKFEIQVTLDMKTALQKIGIREVFSDQADLSRISPVNNCKSVSALCHSGYMSVSEKGTGAERASTAKPEGRADGAAGRRLVTSLSGTPMQLATNVEKTSKSIRVEVDHPFLFAVRHNRTGLMICLGRVETMGDD